MKNTVLFTLFAVLMSITLVLAQNREVRNVKHFTKVSLNYPGKLYLKQGSSQTVELEGDKDALKEVETRVEGSRLMIGKEDKWLNWNGSSERITVYITMTDIEGISVSGSGNIVGQSKIRTDDLELHVSGSGALSLEAEAKGDIEANVAGSGKIELKGTCDDLNSDISGSGNVILSANIQNRASFAISGSGKIEASGSADIVHSSISGSGKILAADLQTNRCKVRISGSGDLEINVKNELDANLSGSGSVRYKSNPAKVNSQASGSGKVRKL